MADNNHIQLGIDIVGNISQFQNSIKSIQGELSKLKMPAKMQDSFTKVTEDMLKQVDKINSLTSNGKNLKLVDTKAVNSSLNEISKLWEGLKSQLNSQGFKGKIELKGIDNINNATAALEAYRTKIADIQQGNKDLKKTLDDLKTSFNEQATKLGVSADDTGIQAVKNQVETLKNAYETAKKAVEDFKAANNAQSRADGGISLTGLTGDLKAEAQRLNSILNDTKGTFNSYRENAIVFEETNNKIKTAQTDLNTSVKSGAKDLQEQLKNLREAFKKELDGLAQENGIKIDWSKPLNTKELSNILNNLEATTSTQFANILIGLLTLQADGTNGFEGLRNQVDLTTNSLNKMGETSAEIDQLFNSFGRIFSLTSGIQLFRKAIRNAYSTIKELDKAMTEVAVVTDFSVGDMWDQLPEYTDKANELGLAIKDVYNASALYYQQGLNTAQVNDMVTSTLHMARIAGLDAATATDRMTNAMRGFNMEINQTNADRVADVYSNLAAKSASNVDELSTAMTKTASIAASANMSFENTAAFLAQGIETTRESADTIGTMLKTVIGRFTEVKKAWNEGELTTEIEGEEINVNRVAEALRTAGINMNDFFTGARGLDEVFIELSSKWNDLDLVTQRYIATQAAGSRQQSRFIAIMQDYARQQELIGYAYNASGASTEQYEKTMDSLDAKLNQLKNAWNSFTMGLANSEFIKGGIDALTGLINLFNTLTDALGTTGGAFAKLALVVGSFLTGRALKNPIKNGLTDEFKSVFEGLGTNSGVKAKFQTSFKNLFGGLRETLHNGMQFISGDITSSLSTALNNIKFSPNNEAFIQSFKAQFKGLGTEDISLLSSKLGEKLNINLSGVKTYDELKAKLDSANVSAEKLKGTLQEINDEAEVGVPRDPYAQFSSACLAASAICGVLSMAIGGVGIALYNSGKISKEAADTLQFLSKAIGLAAAAFMILPPILKLFIKDAAVMKAAFFEITLIIAGLVAVATIIKSIANAIHKNSLEGRLEAAQAKTKELSTAAEECKKNFEDLTNSVNSISDARSALDEMTQGTTEWKEAVIDLNQQVLDLIGRYPELSDAVHNVNGVLEFDTESEAYKSYQNNLLQQSTSAQNAKLIQKAEEADLQNQKDQKDRFETSYVNISGWLGESKSQEVDANTQLYNKYKKAIEENPDTFIGENAFAKWVNSQKVDGYSVTLDESTGKAMFDAFNAQYKADIATDQAIAANYDAIITSTANQVALQTENYDYANVLDNLFSGEKFAQRQSELENEYAITTEDIDSYYKSQGMLGATKDGNKIKYTTATGEVEEVDYANVESAIKTFATTNQTTNEAFEKMNSLVTYFEQNADNLQVQQIKDALSGNMSLTEAANLNTDILDESIIQNLVARSDYTQEEIISIIQDNAEAIKNAELKQLKQTAKNSTKYATNYKNPSQYEKLADAYVTMDFKFDEAGLNFIDFMSGFNTSIESMYGSQAKVQAQNQMNALIEEGDISKVQEFDNFIRNIDLSNPIDGYKNLQNAAINATGASKKFVDTLLEADNSDFGFSKQFAYLTTLEDEYADITGEIKDLVAAEGEINANNVQSVIDKSSKLAQVMKNAKLTTEGMAKVLNLVGQKKASFDTISNAAIAAASKIGQMQAIIDEGLQSLNEFNPGTDEGEAADKLGSIYDTISEMFENGEYGNSQIYNYLKELYGDDFTKAADEDLVEAERTYIERLRLIKENGNAISEWQSKIGVNERKNGPGSVTVGQDENGQLTLDFSEEITKNADSIDDYVDALADAMGWTKQYAKLMLADWKRYSTDFAKVWRDLEGQEAIDAAKGALHKNANSYQKEYYGYGGPRSYRTSSESAGKTVVSKNTLDQVSEVSGKSPDEILKEWGLDSKNTITIGFTIDNEGNIVDQVVDAQKTIEQLGPEFAESFKIPGTDVIDFESMSAEIDSWGLREDISNEIKEGILQGAADEDSAVKVRVQAEDGTFEDVTITPQVNLEDLPNLAEAMKTGEAAETFASAFEEAFNNIAESLKTMPLNFTVTDDSAEQAKSTLTEIGTEEHPVIYNISDECKTALSAALDAVGSGTHTVYYTPSISGNGSLEIQGQSIPVTLKSSASGGYIANNVVSLTGEEGPEIIWGNGVARIVGANGPEITTLHAGEQVFTAPETKKILKNSHGKSFASYSIGTPERTSSYGGVINKNTDATNIANSVAEAASSSSNAAESAEEAAEIWINTLDKLYNLVQLIEEETRRRELLEKKYEKMLRDQGLTLFEVRDNFASQLESLTKQLDYQDQLQKGRLAQINDVANEKYKMGDNVTTYAGSGATNYARYNQATNTIEIDWDSIDAITDEDLGQAVEAYISRLEELQDQYEDTYAEILDIETEIYELKQAYREEYEDFSQRVYDALVTQEEKRIENLEDIYSQIADDNSKVLDELQEQIELERQIRDNTEKEKEIADKENQLAYLRRDTSGGNLLEIKKLEKELENLREDYSDELIDQKLDKLSEDNEKANAQRDLQIEQLNAILEYNKEHGGFWDQVEGLLTSAFNEDGSLSNNSALVELLQQTDSFKAMSLVEQDSWMKDLAAAFEISSKGLEEWKVQEALNKEAQSRGKTGDWTQTNGIEIDGNVYHYNPTTGKWQTGANDEYQTDIAYDAMTGKYKKVNTEKIIKEVPQPPETQQADSSTTFNDEVAKNIAAAIWVYNGSGSGWGDDPTRTQRLTQKFSAAGAAKVKQFVNQMASTGEYMAIWNRLGSQLRSKYSYSAFKTGGLADFTGPAWLDGTKSNPELVLNAKDTQNFLMLKDILADTLHHSSTINNNTNGDNYFNITIDVDSISDDYDVEQLADKIKDEIIKDAKYRNVNALNFLR